jgi:hypothetical protein
MEATMLMPGDATEYGVVGAVLSFGGRIRERYYMLTDSDGVVSLFPADMVEPRPSASDPVTTPTGRRVDPDAPLDTETKT